MRLRPTVQFLSGNDSLAASGASERGASLVEYLLLLMLIVFVAVVSVKFFGESLMLRYSSIVSSVN